MARRLGRWARREVPKGTHSASSDGCMGLGEQVLLISQASLCAAGVGMLSPKEREISYFLDQEQAQRG